MIKLTTFHLSTKYEFEIETMEEALSLAIDAFNNNHELHEISEDGRCLLLCFEVYNAINKRYY